jgi:hypothetical protein
MADFMVTIKDDMNRERIYKVNNIYAIHQENGDFEIHLFAGGPGTQERYDEFVKRYTPFKEKPNDGKRKEAESNPGPQS